MVVTRDRAEEPAAIAAPRPEKSIPLSSSVEERRIKGPVGSGCP
jgi:hypothetical protein